MDGEPGMAAEVKMARWHSGLQQDSELLTLQPLQVGEN